MNLFLKFFIISVVFYSCTSVVTKKPVNSIPIVGKWKWTKSVHVDNKTYLSTPKTIGSSKKIILTEDGRIITYKNDVEIRINKYVLSKGISIFDEKQYDMISFEGVTYLIEKIDNNNLVLAQNSVDGYRSIFIKN
ncbi:hypothetical protein [Flavobacterium sp. 245]|uniref:hypothetical protein n=1 Tax=Flavobacterium sp. 245 TaxID=2512115 RepID=UPI00105B3A6B|nr:hypothetical protein [Flavobacterium sp. 245]TDO94903.1 hypothetical protein EV145_11627 [Flavobacterium sp. 245]